MTDTTLDALPDATDVVILGSGAAGLTAAVTAAGAGLDAVVVEHLPVFGGTSARSSGTVWIPGNRAMRRAGQADDGAADYLAALVGDRGPEPIWRAFLDAAPRMQADLEDRFGLTLRPFPGAPDYRQDLPGAAPGWRAMEPPEVDGRALGPLFPWLAPPLPEMTILGGMMVTRAEAARLLRADRSIPAAWLGLRLTARHLRDRLEFRRGTRLVLGNALVAGLMLAALRAGVALRRCVVTGRLLVGDTGRAEGIEVGTAAGPRLLRARRGVILAGGGFPADPDWRARELPHPTANRTPASPGASGATLRLGQSVGAALGPSGLDNALWFPSSVGTRPDGTEAIWPHIVLDRAKPGSLAVNAQGKRFVNEAVSYHEFVRAMYRDPDAVPCWMICDRGFIARYGLGLIRPRTPSIRHHVASGYLVKAADAEALARRLRLPGAALAETIARFNRFARAGRDPDFQRGETIYERANGDPARPGNPCLGEVGPGPLYALRLEPTPLGTSRGLLTDTVGRVRRRDGSAIGGLYACGNDMQSAFGGEYPGAGAQLGQGMTFAWLAARAIAAQD